MIETFSISLKRMRILRGLTQYALHKKSKELGGKITRQAIFDIESGSTAEPRLSTAVIIAKALDADLVVQGLTIVMVPRESKSAIGVRLKALRKTKLAALRDVNFEIRRIVAKKQRNSRAIDPEEVVPAPGKSKARIARRTKKRVWRGSSNR